MGDIRIGKVSSIDYENGMIRVLYTDRDGAVTKTLPVVTFNTNIRCRRSASTFWWFT